jgi:histidinol phosphatase-like PHP family hydrolase
MLVQSDYHMHATYYRLKNPGDVSGPLAVEQVNAARNAGSEFVGIVEHCNTSLHHPFHCLEELSAEYYADGFDRHNVWLGVEADLAEDGSDACSKCGREKLGLHYVIGSVHLAPKIIASVTDYIESEFKRISNALKYNDNIDIIGHPFGEGIRWERSGAVSKWQWNMIPDEYLSEVIRLAGESGKALEMNRCDLNDPVYVDFWNRIRDNGVFFSVGSDAHSVGGTFEVVSRTAYLEAHGFSESKHWKVSIK